MSSEYKASDIKPIRWGKLVQLSPSHWQTSWTIDLESIDTSQIDGVISATYEPLAGFEAELTVQRPRTISAVIKTTHWGMELDYYELTYQLFRLINSRIGRIHLINGAPRDWWQPFRIEQTE